MKTKLVLKRVFKVVLCVQMLLALATVAPCQLALRRALDFDGNGRADLTVFSPINQWKSQGSNNPGYFGFGIATIDILTPGDFDGDGVADVAVWRESNGAFYYLRSSNNSFATVLFGSPGDEPVARDYDGDSKTDCAIVRRTGSQLVWHILFSSNNYYASYQYGISDDVPIPGDYDGDGRFDLAVARRYPNEHVGLFMERSTMGPLGVEFGHSDDIVAPGDYDGDGKTDLALVRDLGSDSGVQWNIIHIPSFSVDSHIFGDFGEGDMPTQADYDGDGKTDLAVWREPDGFFHIFQSSDSQLVSINHGETGDLPIATYDSH